jgi:hypothetical protein
MNTPPWWLRSINPARSSVPTAMPQQIAADLHARHDLGVTAVDFSIGGDSADVAEIRRFRETVLAKV